MRSKICTKCGKELPATTEYFYKMKNGKYGLSSQCKECRDKYGREWRKNNPEKSKQLSRKYHINRLKRKYNIGKEDYNSLLEGQNNRCAICGINNEERNFDIDHDHKNGKVRGLLCNNCNKLLGMAHDNPLILIKAVKYLRY